MTSGRGLAAWLKAAWVLAVVAAALVFVVHRWTDAAAALATVAWPGVVFAVVFLLAAKCVMVLLAHRVLQRTTGLADLPFALYAYNISQVAKYIPGGIWQHASRALIYRRRGISIRETAWAIGAEAVWLVGPAVVFGAVFASTSSVTIVANAPAHAVAALAAVFGVSLAGSAVFTCRLQRRVSPPPIPVPLGLLRPDMFLLSYSAMLWPLMGASVMSLLPEMPLPSLALALHVSGAFALGYAAGFLTPFAPAGIGIREAAVVAVLAPLAPIDALLAVTIVHRLLYCGVDLGLAGLAMLARPARMPNVAL